MFKIIDNESWGIRDLTINMLKCEGEYTYDDLMNKCSSIYIYFLFFMIFTFLSEYVK